MVTGAVGRWRVVGTGRRGESGILVAEFLSLAVSNVFVSVTVCVVARSFTGALDGVIAEPGFNHGVTFRVTCGDGFGTAVVLV